MKEASTDLEKAAAADHRVRLPDRRLKFEASSDRVNDYAISECGIDLDGSDPSDAGAQPDDSGSITDPGAAQDLADTFSGLGDNPQALQALMGIFGVDEETAECLIEELGDLDAMFARGEFAPLKTWLNENVHRRGRRYKANRLTEIVTGKKLSHEPLLEHLKQRFGELYGL